jgi:catalase
LLEAYVCRAAKINPNLRGIPMGEDEDFYTQSGLLFRLMSAAQKKALVGNTARAFGDAPEETKKRHIGNCLKADPAYGKGVAAALGLSIGRDK